MQVTLIAKPQFIAHDDRTRRSREDQLQGTDGERLAEYAGRACYDSFGRGRNSADFHQNIIDHKHVNVLYHANYTMLIEGVSRMLAQELTRHHVGFSPSMRSTRYCDESESSTVQHPYLVTLVESDEALAQALHDADVVWRKAYGTVVKAMKAAGHDHKTAQGAAARQAPLGLCTDIVWTGNVAAYLSMTERRSVPGLVDAEFVKLSGKMREILRVEMPAYFKEAK